MNMRQRQREIEKLIEKWQPLLLLDHWDVFVSIETVNKASDPTIMAEIQTRPRYMEASMTIYPWFWDCPDAKTKEYREATLAHELCHIVVAPLDEVAGKFLEGHHVTRDQAAHANESVTEHIAKIAVRLAR